MKNEKLDSHNAVRNRTDIFYKESKRDDLGLYISLFMIL